MQVKLFSVYVASSNKAGVYHSNPNAQKQLEADINEFIKDKEVHSCTITTNSDHVFDQGTTRLKAVVLYK